jgi:hypothetical protein
MERKTIDIESLRDEFYTFKIEVNERLNTQDTRVDYLYFKFDEMKDNIETKFDFISQQVKVIESSSKNNYKIIFGSLILIFLFILLLI